MRHLPCIAAALVVVPVASADTLRISGDAGAFDLAPTAAIDAFALGGAGTGDFTTAALSRLHSRINGTDDPDIASDDKVTFLAAAVTGANGPELAFLTLVDGEYGRFTAFDSSLAFESRVSRDLDAWVNDRNERITVATDPTDGDAFEYRAAGTFRWDRDGKGDAFAWSGLEAGDSGDVTLRDDVSLAGGLGEYQFLTWTGRTWAKVAGGTFGDGFNVQFAVVPLPLAAWIGLAGLAGVGVARRRLDPDASDRLSGTGRPRRGGSRDRGGRRR